MGLAEDLNDARERLWDAINGNRLLERDGKDGETYTAREPLAPLVRELRSVAAAIDALERAKGRKGSLVDELADRREARGSDAKGVAGSGGGS